MSDPVEPLPLPVGGRPLHTRVLCVEVFKRDPQRVRARCALQDLRKSGFVPTGGQLQGAGLIPT